MGRWLLPVLKRCLADCLAGTGFYFSSQIIDWSDVPGSRAADWCFLFPSVAGIEAADRLFLTTPPHPLTPPPSLLPSPAETGLLWAHSDGHVSLAYACAGNLINEETSFRQGSCFRRHGMLPFCKK